MKKILKLISIFMLVLSSFMMRADFVMAETGYEPITVKVPVFVHGVEGDVVVSNWPNELKDKRYDINGPLPTHANKHVGAEKKVDLEFTFSEFGNYVYQVEEPITTVYNTDSSVEYDKRVYRLYITIVSLYDETVGEDVLFAAVEAENCGMGGASCKYNEVYDVPPYEGGHTPSPVPVPTPTPTPGSDPIPKVAELHFDNIQGFWVRYTNGEEPYYYKNPTGGTYGPDDNTGRHGTSSEFNGGNYSEEQKPYDSYPVKHNGVNPNSGYRFTGQYKYIITRDAVDENGHKILDPNGRPIQVIVPDEEWVFHGRFFSSEAEARAAVDIYNATRALDEPLATYDDILHCINTPMGYTNDPLSIHHKGNITFIPVYEAVPPTPRPNTPGWWVPYTGDPTSLMLYGGLFGGSLLLIVILLLYRRKQKNTF